MACSATPRPTQNSISSTEPTHPDLLWYCVFKKPSFRQRSITGLPPLNWINFYQIFWRLMWKSIGSVHSGENKSVRSNRSREELPFEPFHQSIARRSNLSPDPNRSFCFEYFEHKKEDSRNITFNSRVKSEHKSQPGRKEDMFTSIRNILAKDDPASKLDSNAPKNPEEDRNQIAAKQALARVKALKRQQGKLKTTVENEFNVIKNYFYQLEEIMHAEQTPARQSSTDADPALIREIYNEAAGVERFFQEMDRKKAAIMQRLSLRE